MLSISIRLIGIIASPFYLVLQLIKGAYIIFVKIPDHGSPYWYFSLRGIFRLVIFAWLLCAIQSDTTEGFPGVAWKCAFHDFKESHEILGFLFMTFICIQCLVQLFVTCGLAHDNDPLAGQLPYSALDETLGMRDMMMNQMTGREKAQALADTGFMTKNTYRGRGLSTNEKEAFNMLDAQLMQESSRGKIDLLKKMFKGK